MKTQIVILSAAATAVAGCTSGLPGLRPLTHQEPSDTRLLVSYADCPNTPADGPNLAPVLASIAIGAASKLLEGFGTALTKGAEGGNLPASVATTNVELDAGETPRCLIAIRGQFQPKRAGEQPVVLPIPAQTVTVAGEPPQLPLLIKTAKGSSDRAGLPEVYSLQHYVELQLVASRNQSALTFAPIMTRIARSMDGQRSGSRELSVAIKFERPGKDPVGGAVLVNDHAIGADRAYKVLPSGRFEKEAPWFVGIQTSAAAKSGGTALAGGAAGGTGNSSGTVPQSPPSAATTPQAAAAAVTGIATAGPFPYTVTATVVETRPTREFLAFVASVFGAARPAIESELKSELDSTTIRAEANTALDAEGAFADALGKAHSAVLIYCALPSGDEKKAERFAKSGEARKAQIAANKAALAADAVAPFASLVTVSGSAPATSNSSACT